MLSNRMHAASACRELKAMFESAHPDAMACLRRRDYDAFGNAIERERQIIREQAHILASAVKSRLNSESAKPL